MGEARPEWITDPPQAPLGAEYSWTYS